MIRQFFDKAAQHPSRFETGFHGRPSDIVTAVEAIEDVNAAPLQLMEIAMGATEALAQGRPENLQAFFSHPSEASQYDAYILSQLVTGITSCQLKLALKDMPQDRKRLALEEAKSLLSNDTGHDHGAVISMLDAADRPPGQDMLKLRNG